MTKFLVEKFIKNYNETSNPEVRRKYGILSGIVGIIINIILFIAKFFVGIMSSSISVTADAFNNFFDAGGSIVTLACFKMSGAPADSEHPFGHGRVEYVSGLIISVVIILTGFEFIKSSIEKIFTPEDVNFSTISIIILVCSLLCKLWMGLFNNKLGKMISSSAMKASAVDSLADVAATCTVLLSMVITYISGVSVDAYAGIVVALVILFTGFSMIKETLGPLIGQAPDKELVNSIKSFVLSYPNVVGVHDLIVHNYGPSRLIISLHAEMPYDVDIITLHNTIDQIEKDLKEKFKCEATIHLDPLVINDEFINSAYEKLQEFIHQFNPECSIHDLRTVAGKPKATILFDVEVPYKVKMSDNEIIYFFEKFIEQNIPGYNPIISIDRICD